MPKTTTELQIRLPMWEELPAFSLHLDQLLDLTNEYLEPIIGDKITKTMLHNYFKAKILVPPVKKKYQRTQLAGAIVVGLLKNIFTLNEVKAGLITLLGNGTPKTGYNNFVIMFKMQYDAVQSILFWLSAKNRLHEMMDPQDRDGA
ncbi:DUF1836 domain-containing protein [Lentilactobacillus buchneri]|nr:DUF1836 domain-containing protein [Lentilactobacillus sp. Egmn17]